MLSATQIKQAKSLAFEYVQSNRGIDAIKSKLNTPNLKPESREQYQEVLASIEQNKRNIEETFLKDYSVELQQLQDRTPIGIMYHVRKGEKEIDRNLSPTHPDRPQEPVKKTITQTWAINSAQVEEERHGESKQSEPELKPITERTITVTREQKPLTHHERPAEPRRSFSEEKSPFLQRYMARAEELIRKQQQTPSRDKQGRDR